MLHMRDYARIVRQGIGASIKEANERIKRNQREVDELVQNFALRVKNMVTRELNEKIPHTNTLEVAIFVEKALRGLEGHEVRKVLNVSRIDQYQQAVEWFNERVTEEVRGWVEAHGFRILSFVFYPSGTLRLAISLRGATRLRGLARFMIVCSRYRRDFYKPGMQGYENAKASFEKTKMGFNENENE